MKPTTKLCDPAFKYVPSAVHDNSSDAFKARMKRYAKQVAETPRPKNVTPISEKKRSAK